MRKDTTRPIDPSTFWTISNVITLIRICLVPVFVVALLSPWPDWMGVKDVISHDAKSIIAAMVFILISCTDWLDGYLARSRNEVTNFGKFIDPLADKILVVAALLALIELQVLPSWPVLIIITREFIVSGLRMLAATKGEVIAASWYGKAKTVAQILAIILFLVKDIFKHEFFGSSSYEVIYVISWIVMAAAIVLTIVSMIDYIYKAWPIIRAKETSSSVRCDIDMSDLAKLVIKEAGERGLSIASAESLTGGMICACLTEVPGASSVVKGCVASYTNEIKNRVLGVGEALLANEGAVSSRCAEQMARGVSRLFEVDIAVSVTGIAGPGGAEPGKPVGTVFMAVVFKEDAHVYEFHFKGSRDEVREQTCRCALRKIAELVV